MCVYTHGYIHEYIAQICVLSQRAVAPTLFPGFYGEGAVACYRAWGIDGRFEAHLHVDHGQKRTASEKKRGRKRSKRQVASGAAEFMQAPTSPVPNYIA